MDHRPPWHRLAPTARILSNPLWQKSMTKILLVDDEPSYRDSLRPILSQEGYEVQAAADSRAALAFLPEFVPDVLLIDWMLRDTMDGLELAEAVRAVHPSVRTIFITGYPTSTLQARISSLPQCCYLVKPFLLADLLAAVRDAATHTASRQGREG